MTLALERRARTAHGEIAFDVLGDGPDVVLVHGTPSRAVVWRSVARELSRDFRVHVFDLLGFGASERSVEQDVSLVVHGQVLAELIEHWGLAAPALVGHDIGGATVLRAHLLENAPATRIALIDAVVLAPWITPRTRAMQRNLSAYDPLPDAQLAATIREHLGTATHRPVDEDVFAALFGQWEGAHGQALYLRNLAQFDEDHTQELEPLLASISVPVLVAWGEEDAWLPVADSERIAARIPRARRVVIPGAGHFCMEDRPDAVAAALRSFLTGLP